MAMLVDWTVCDLKRMRCGEMRCDEMGSYYVRPVGRAPLEIIVELNVRDAFDDPSK